MAALVSLCLVVALGVEASPVSAKARGASTTPPVSSNARYLDQLLAAGAPGAIARIRVDDDVWAGAAGFADHARTEATRTDMIWRIASVTKLVSAHLALALEREGVIRLSDTLGRYNAHLPARYRAIKISALLDQTSRVPEYLDYDVFGTTARAMIKSIATRDLPETSLNAALTRPWFVDEMAEHQYANTNYVLLQHAMEQAAGASFADLIAWHVINPLRLTQTGLVGDDGELPDRPHLRGHIRDDKGRAVFAAGDRLMDVTRHHFLTGADGGLYTNASELAKMMDLIWSANAHDGVALGAMTRQLKFEHDGMYRYGYGVMAVKLRCGRTVYGHEGLDLGSVTYAFADRSNRRQLIVVANVSTDQNVALDAALQRMRDAVFCAR